MPVCPLSNRDSRPCDTFKTFAAAATLKFKGSRMFDWIARPGCGGFFIGMAFLIRSIGRFGLYS